MTRGQRIRHRLLQAAVVPGHRHHRGLGGDERLDTVPKVPDPPTAGPDTTQQPGEGEDIQFTGGRAAQCGQERTEGGLLHLPGGGAGRGQRPDGHHPPLYVRHQQQEPERHQPATGHYDQHQRQGRFAEADQRGVQPQPGPLRPAGGQRVEERHDCPEAGGEPPDRHLPRLLCDGGVGGHRRAGGRLGRSVLRRPI